MKTAWKQIAGFDGYAVSDTGHIRITFASIREASQAMGIDYSTIHGAAHGKFKHAGGWCFGFAN